MPPIHGINPDNGEDVIREPKDGAPLALLAFKIMDDPFVGTITFCRIIRTLCERHRRDQFDQGTQRAHRRHAADACEHREDIKEAFPGDIVALAGLKEVRTGDTLCDPKQAVILETWNSPIL